jgi:hypothetical protein
VCPAESAGQISVHPSADLGHTNLTFSLLASATASLHTWTLLLSVHQLP